MNDGPVSTFQFLGLTFSTANVVSGTIVFLIAVAVIFFASRHISMKPSKGQNFLEWLIEFTNGILKGSIPADQVSSFGLYGFTLFLFLFLSNQLGLFLQLTFHGATIVRSPTSDPIVTLTFSLMTMMLAQFSGVQRLGYKKHFANYLKPFVFWLPISIFEEFTNFLTLGLRIFGVIFSGEMLLKVIWGLATSHGIATMIVAVPIEMIWQGFSAFLGAIQAFVFVTLSTVYISQKIEEE
ncbi:F0F1 ATP synthase subunit A [Levilactobacillus spicheri]|uniref:ATP synthase subunit a n=2 Tax=Levilactobacillus spicheri TaxID=216463 RepID=A0A0F3RQN3_9LACO|nr:F0F1 ATP synthase subunit A [Levilactobacillus spicheri]KJW11899.1 ATP synthase subunit A [Levilactobacillus spicheri]KRL46646.1 F0F1-type ATP synthase, subunit a [Levilactobacillus spicheri DSM 15429]GEO66020.1 ATP synthase subunit a [Levilactobacillus spicheri]